MAAERWLRRPTAGRCSCLAAIFLVVFRRAAPPDERQEHHRARRRRALELRQFFDQSAYLVLTNTFWIAVLSRACLVIGYPYAYLMSIVPGRIAGLLVIAVLLPFWSSLLVRHSPGR